MKKSYHTICTHMTHISDISGNDAHADGIDFDCVVCVLLGCVVCGILMYVLLVC